MKKLFIKGFTLVELLVVMAIIGILVTLVGSNFRSAQIRGRDVQRKSDLKQISTALELFYADYGQYPSASSGEILACPYVPGGGTACTWGKDEFTDDGKTIYIKRIPGDPTSSYYYFYRTLDSNSKFQLFARLENSQDQDCLGGDCSNSPVAHVCGTGVACNFALTSANTDATE